MFQRYFIIFLKPALFFCGFLFANISDTTAQCTTPISSYPYTEGFEINDGGWTPGGSASDWAWGTPSKPVITAAATGSKCWITGGLTGSSYNNGESSQLVSPCFDFSALVDPQVIFSVFWETEKRFDGANMEYSTNGGTAWILLGSVNENPCNATNWYNNSSINFLGGNNGWSGNIQSTAGSCQGGSGSNGWLIARHSLSFLAGAPSVIFRFRFGAGNTCNNFDGFAIDDITISETPANSGDFSYACTADRNVAFTSTAVTCPTGYAWDFGDPASGTTNNSSTAPNPSHVFTAAGTYLVTLDISFGMGTPVHVTHNIEITDVNINPLQPINCNGGLTGAIVALATGGSSSYNYLWNTSPPQTTPGLNNIGAGSYTVMVSSATSCTTSATYVLAEPAAINITAPVTHAVCNNNNGSITATVTGGTSPYGYAWSNGGTGNVIGNLSPGSYFLNITDAKGCNASKNNLIVDNILMPVNVSLGKDITSCPGQKVELDPGTFSSYRWKDNSIAPTLTVTVPGTYWVKVTNSIGCTGSDTINVSFDCSDIYFPGAFTPNTDRLNDHFGPVGTAVSRATNYTLRIYDRYGQIIFYSTDPFKKWDGKIKGAAYNSGTFTWFASYTLLGKTPQEQKGTVILIR